MTAWRSGDSSSRHELCAYRSNYNFRLAACNVFFAVAAVLHIKVDMASTVEQLLNAETPLATPVDVEQPFAAKGSYFVLEVSHLSCLETRISLQERPKL